MDILRRALIPWLFVAVAPSAALATPVDVTRDLLYAVEYGRGGDFLNIMSSSLRSSIEDSYRQLQEISFEEPGAAEALLQRTGSGITVWDLEWMTTEDFVSALLPVLDMPSPEEVVFEEVSMRGRNAEVVFTWQSGISVTFFYTWEVSSWKLTGSSLLEDLF
ncbi:MAG: hypothetical protein AVO35_00755 [Candidatus Aegiribacteria sp. MLS_C]|nr:MAG: hypothetical protein AVO35_00755 [Candidatus Aegiribacteria sp. MLS_C]